MKHKIKNFHQDAEYHWVADLTCGHKQHMRHDPPLVSRPWVTTPEGRNSMIGHELECKICDETGLAVATELQKTFIKLIQDSFERGGLGGMCSEGQQALALDALKTIDLLPLVQRAICRAISDEAIY